jgi:hypothetical protein
MGAVSDVSELVQAKGVAASEVREPVVRDEPAPARPVQRWLADAWRVIREDLIEYGRTALAVSLRPARFAAEWSQGQRRALNPVAFLGTALAVSSPIFLAFAHFAGQDRRSSMWDAFLADQVAPYVQYAVLGLLAHAFLRLAGGGRQPLLATLAIVLFAGGGPALFVDLLTLPIDPVLARAAASEDSPTNLALTLMSTVSIAAANLVFFVTFARGLAGLHGVRTWRPLAALAAAYLALGVVRYALFAWLGQPA